MAISCILQNSLEAIDVERPRKAKLASRGLLDLKVTLSIGFMPALSGNKLAIWLRVAQASYQKTGDICL